MRWTAEVAAGAWLGERLDRPWRGTIHDVVPRGYEAYARVLHPAWRSRPLGASWPPSPPEEHRAAWDRFAEQAHAVETERVTWERTAATFGTRLTPAAAWTDLVATDAGRAGAQPRDADGWLYDAPPIGGLEPDLLAALARVLLGHTTTPDDGRLAVWEGWGGLVGAMATTPSRTFAQASDDPVHHRMLSDALPDRFRSPFAQQRWHPGILSDEISRGPRLRLPHRDHVLFSAGVRELATPDWLLTAPWRDREAEAYGFAPSAQAPNLLWPTDRAWVMVSEIDWDTTVVAGSRDLVAAVCAHPDLEAVPIPPGNVLTQP